MFGPDACLDATVFLRLGTAKDIHLGRPDEAGHKLVARSVVKLQRAADLLDMACTQNDDLVGHGHGFDLIVGHVNHGGFQAFVQFADLKPHADAQGSVEVRQRFVEEERGGFADNRAANGDTLALTARKLARTTVEIVGEVQNRRRVGDPLFDLGGVHLGHLQREGDVLAHRHMRIKRIGLEHHRQTTLGGNDIGRVFAIDLDMAGSDVLKPRDQPQQRGFPAARGADENRELSVLDGQVKGWDDLHVAKAFGDLFECDLSHGSGSLCQVVI